MANSFTTAGVPTTMTLSGIATIENGDQTSAAIPNSGRAVVRLGFPTITSTTLTFQVQAYPATGTVAGASFRSLVDKDGNAISYTIGSNKIVTIPELSGCAAFKLVMGSDEASTRSIEVTSRGDQPVVSPTEIDVDIESGATITANQGTPGASAWPVTPYASAAAAAASSVYSPVTSVVTAALIKASAGNVLKLYATNANAAVRWFQLHNKATIPVATDVPQLSVPIPAGTANNPGYVEIDLRYADPFATGIGFAISSTQGTFTDAATAGEHAKIVEYA